MLRLAIASYSAPSRLALDAHDSPRKAPFVTFRGIAPLDGDVLIVVDKVEADLEMHDKIIVATALHFRATLITKDKAVTEAEIVPILWSAREKVSSAPPQAD